MSLYQRALVLLTLFLVLVVAPAGGYAGERASAPMRAWDGILPGDRFSDIADFGRTISQEGNERVYVFTAPGGDGAVLMSILVSVGPVGKRLDPAAWQSAVDGASAADKARDFPQIGSRAARRSREAPRRRSPSPADRS